MEVMKKAYLFSIIGGLMIPFSLSAGAEQVKPKAPTGNKVVKKEASPQKKGVVVDEKKTQADPATTAETPAKTYSDREISEATLKTLIGLMGQISSALAEVKDKSTAEACIAKLAIIKGVKDKVQEHTKHLPPPDPKVSKELMNIHGPVLQNALMNLNKEVVRIQKDRYYDSLEFRTALENLLKSPASGMPII